MKTVGIVGGSGYTGGELIRLIINHPKLKGPENTVSDQK